MVLWQVIQTNSSYSDIYYISQQNVLEVKLKLLDFSSLTLVMQKVQKVWTLI